MIIIGFGLDHQHCNFCDKCLIDDAAWPYLVGTFFVDLWPGEQPPREFEEDTWIVCTKCAEMIDRKDVAGIVDRVVLLAGDKEELREDLTRVLTSFVLFIKEGTHQRG